MGEAFVAIDDLLLEELVGCLEHEENFSSDLEINPESFKSSLYKIEGGFAIYSVAIDYDYKFDSKNKMCFQKIIIVKLVNF